MSFCVETDALTWRNKDVNRHIREEVGGKTCQRELTKQEKDVLAKKLQSKVSATLANVKAPLSNFTTVDRKALASLKRDQNITISPMRLWGEILPVATKRRLSNIYKN